MARAAGIIFLTMNSVAVVMGRPEVLPIAGGLGTMSSWGLGGMIFGSNKDGQRGQCYAVNSKCSIDLKTHFFCPRVDQVHHSAETSFYPQMISWALEMTYWLVVWAGFQAGDWGE